MVEQLRHLAKNIRGIEEGKYGIGAGMIDNLANYLEPRKLIPASLESNDGVHKEDVPALINPIWTEDSSGKVQYLHPLFSFFPEARKVKVGKKETELARKENKLLKVFVKNPNKVLTGADLMDAVWDERHETDIHVKLRTRIYALRKKIEPDYHKPQIVVRVVDEKDKKSGYMLKDESRLGQEPEKEETIVYPGFTYFPERECMVVNGSQISFTPTENDILKLMFKKLGMLVGFSDFGGKKATITCQLRRKIKSSGLSILTERGKGYMLVNPGVK